MQQQLGITFAGGPDPRTCDDLLHDADTAMFDAKSAGRGCFRVFVGDSFAADSGLIATSG